MFPSDHGPGPYAGNILKATPGQIKLLEEKGHYPSGPHRGYKFSVYEGGLRVPLIASWPHVIPEGQTCDALVGLNDFMATFAELSGTELGEAEGPDSISFAKLLSNPNATARRHDLVMQSVGAFVIRDENWKLCLCPGSGTPAGSPHTVGNEPTPEDAWRRALAQFSAKPRESDLYTAPFVQLFNLENDLHEDNDLAAKFPERVARMVSLLQRQVDDGRSTPGPKLQNDTNVRIVSANDKRLPEFARERLH